MCMSIWEYVPDIAIPLPRRGKNTRPTSTGYATLNRVAPPVATILRPIRGENNDNNAGT